MKSLVFGVLLLALSVDAHTQTLVCQTIGNMTTCNGVGATINANPGAPNWGANGTSMLQGLAAANAANEAAAALAAQAELARAQAEALRDQTAELEAQRAQLAAERARAAQDDASREAARARSDAALEAERERIARANAEARVWTANANPPDKEALKEKLAKCKTAQCRRELQ
jgi:hypothetical protein